MSREDGRDVDVTSSTDDEADGRQPLVEVNDDVRRINQTPSELQYPTDQRTAALYRVGKGAVPQWGT